MDAAILLIVDARDNLQDVLIHLMNTESIEISTPQSNSLMGVLLMLNIALKKLEDK